MSAAAATRSARTGEASTARIARLFMIGSACFAVASLPGMPRLTDRGVAITYAAGSVFFTMAALEQLRTSRPARLDRWSSAVQLAGTILFNVSTFIAVDERLDPHSVDYLVWAPDAIGSACFLVSSGLASAAVWSQRADRRTRLVADLNLAGSVAFGWSALASYVIPDTGQVANAAAASSGTLIGAVCFFVAAWLLRREADPG
jgi:hypothetical protein